MVPPPEHEARVEHECRVNRRMTDVSAQSSRVEASVGQLVMRRGYNNVTRLAKAEEKITSCPTRASCSGGGTMPEISPMSMYWHADGPKSIVIGTARTPSPW